MALLQDGKVGAGVHGRVGNGRESICVALAPMQINMHEVTAAFIFHLLSRWDSLNRHSLSTCKHMEEEDFVLLDLDVHPALAAKAGSKLECSRMVVRQTYLKLNLKRKFEGELESMQDDGESRLLKVAHEVLLANIALYYLETVPVFALPGLVQPYAGQVDLNEFFTVYSSRAKEAVVNQVKSYDTGSSSWYGSTYANLDG